MSIKSILEQKGSNVVTIRPGASVKTAADLMRRERIAALMLTSGDSIVGVFTERDLVAAVSEFGQAALSLNVEQVSSRTVIPIAPRDSVKTAMSLMTRYRVRHLPVIENGRLHGIVSIGDVVKSRLDDLQTESNVLRDAYLAAQPVH